MPLTKLCAGAEYKSSVKACPSCPTIVYRNNVSTAPLTVGFVLFKIRYKRESTNTTVQTVTLQLHLPPDVSLSDSVHVYRAVIFQHGKLVNTGKYICFFGWRACECNECEYMQYLSNPHSFIYIPHAFLYPTADEVWAASVVCSQRPVMVLSGAGVWTTSSTRDAPDQQLWLPITWANLLRESHQSLQQWLLAPLAQ